MMDPEILNPSVIMDSVYGILNRIDYQFDIRKKVQLLKDYAYAHPFWAIFVLITAAVLTVPVGAFILFAGGTIAFTFVGFIFVEGTLLTIGAIFMIAILSVLGFISLGFAGCVFVTYFLLSGGLTFLSSTSDKLKHKMNQRMHKQGSHVEVVSRSMPKDDYVFVKNGSVGQENGYEPKTSSHEMNSDTKKNG